MTTTPSARIAAIRRDSQRDDHEATAIGIGIGIAIGLVIWGLAFLVFGLVTGAI